jgi:hypothetical protein
MGDTLHHYDGHRTVCTLEDKAIAARLGGHSWNIINNKDEHEIYLRHARNDHHYINDKGQTSSDWFHKKKRILDDTGRMQSANHSRHMTEALTCPRTPGRNEAEHHPPYSGRERYVKQLIQATSPNDFALYTARRNEALPATPRRDGHLERSLGLQNQLRLTDVTERITPRVVDKSSWTPRRVERIGVPRPPKEQDMFASVDQLRTESHVDVKHRTFAKTLRPPSYSQLMDQSSKTSGTATPRGSTAASSTRSSLQKNTPRHRDEVSAIAVAATASGLSRNHGEHPKPAHERTNHSTQRIDGFAQREISNWPNHDDRLCRQDPYHLRPLMQPTNSGVKYDIITNERHQYWY